MRIIPVIDVLDGQVVAACAGQRQTYRPIQSELCEESDPFQIAQAMATQIATQPDNREFYLADLNRLQGGQPNLTAWQSIGQVASRLWLDTGTRNENDLQQTARLVTDQLLATAVCDQVTLICAIESWQDEGIPMPPRLSPPTTDANHLDLAFGLDLKHGKLVTQQPSPTNTQELVRQIINAGWKSIVVLDVAAVGMGEGCPTFPICTDIRSQNADIEIVTGGGVRHREDVELIRSSGYCDGLLVSSAIHRGLIP